MGSRSDVTCLTDHYQYVDQVNLDGMVMEKLITKLDIVNAVIAAGKNNTYVSSSATVVADETKIGAQ